MNQFAGLMSELSLVRRISALATVAATVAMSAAGPVAAGDRTPTTPMVLAQASKAVEQRPRADLDALIRAAKAEGEVTFYISLPEVVGKRTADAFTAKYGIRTQFVRLVTAVMPQRYFAEADAGNIAADLLFVASTPEIYATEGIKKGYVEPIAQAGVPVIVDGELPSKFVRGISALVQIIPWVISYDSTKVKGADIPKTWADVLNPKWKGQLISPDPRTGQTYAAVWNMILSRYGESFVTQLRALNFRQAPGGASAIQSLAAGEGAINFPSIVALVQGPKSKGATIDYVIPSYNTGVESSVVLTARGKAKHPNSARLLANYVLSREGNAVFNADPGGITLYDETGLPSEYVAPDDSGGSARLAAIAKMMGYQ